MPCLVVSTNVAKSAVPDGFFQKATDAVANLTGKPSGYIQVRLVTDQQMSFGGSQDPTADITFRNVGNIKKPTAECSSVICKLLNEQLGIASDRIYIFFMVSQGSNVGWDGRTF